MHIKDHVSKFSALFAQTSKEASECANSLAIFIKFMGCPEIYQSDNGRQFKGVLVTVWTSDTYKDPCWLVGLTLNGCSELA